MSLTKDADAPLTMDGYDDCVAGVVCRCGQPPIICYDLDKVLSKLRKMGMSQEEAVEFYEFNQVEAWMGEDTPCFIKRGKLKDFTHE